MLKLSEEEISERRKRAKIIFKELKKLFPDAKIALNFSNSWELLVAVVLSAQCTDKMVNVVTEKLFKKYKSLDDYVKADLIEFEQGIHSTGFYHNKAKNILATAKIIKEKYKGEIPCTMEQLVELPGVARKTANIILGNACGVVVGIAVDTHVRRLANLLKLSEYKDPNKIEQDLMQIFPRKQWNQITFLLIDYGRRYCAAKKHDHENCPLTKILSNQ
ncbi:MAG: Endonuclease III [Candidatus Moranbacteria bacterium GW2011_GWC2_37_8]|nr:MAG: Endonuclease III [Candidatus Moranbacteria bacterium GW2011_GWC2_37_8]KKQ63070.1 MAG: Endonuclease III [Parcubacteria group bacterium GW2011_GWC1_38_22]KKQ79723.1 MAG: Endonuclease III [Candidatus Moranbacteria bacterium GW2011_GWD2_38_7]